VLAALEDSGLTMAAFAVREGLDRQRLRRWRRVLGAPSRGPLFEEIPRHEVLAAGAVVTEPEAVGVLEVVLASGRVVRVPPAFDAPTLRRLLAVLDEVGAC
jgi:lambda repressor-like predicted transcriptional regulator